MGAIAGIGMAIASLVGGVAESEAQADQGRYQEHMFNVNAKLAEDQAADAVKRGDQEANQVAQKVKQVRGSQRVAYAAQGIDVNSGVAAEVQADTEALGAIDMVKIREGAWREAWGYKVEAINSRSKGQFARQAGDAAARTTLLTGGLKALGYGAEAATKFGGSGNTKKVSVPSYSASDEWFGGRGPGSR